MREVRSAIAEVGQVASRSGFLCSSTKSLIDAAEAVMLR